MYVTNEIETATMQQAVLESPLSKSAIKVYLEVYSNARKYLDTEVFRHIQNHVGEISGSALNLKDRLDRANMGRFITIGELSYRRCLPEGVQPVSLLPGAYAEEPPSQETQQVKQLRQERDRAQEMLREYEAFCRLLLLGRILPAPVETNGLEEAPLLQVFGGARSLSEVHTAYRELRKAWHPDISPHSEGEANDRFHWLKQAYTLLTQNWSRFDPQNQDIPQSRIEKLKAQKLRWEPHTFWYWKDGTEKH